jgi:hypothetical protein
MTHDVLDTVELSVGKPKSHPCGDTLLARLWERESSRPALMEDCCGLIDKQAAAGRGIKAATLRACYRAVLGVQPGIIGYVLGKLMPDYLAALEPLFAESQELAHSTGSDPARAFRESLEATPARVTDTLLGVTDERMPSARLPIRVAYKAVRNEAWQPVFDGVPALAELLEHHLRSIAPE